MKLLIDISEYNAEYIRNAYRVPQDINMAIAEAIINGKQIPAPHGRLIDADKFEFEMNDKLLVALTEKYGEEEAKCGLYFSFRDCISNIQYQPTVIEAEGEA